MNTLDWVSGGPKRSNIELNPRGWIWIDYSTISQECIGYSSGCHCANCLQSLRHDGRPLPVKLQGRYQAKRRARFASDTMLHTPLCASVPMLNPPDRVTSLSEHIDATSVEISHLEGREWLAAFQTRLANGLTNYVPWEGNRIWAAGRRAEFTDFATPWYTVGWELKMNGFFPDYTYPSKASAGKQAPFVDVGLGAGLAFTWLLSTRWDIQSTAGIVSTITQWASQASGRDESDGDLADSYTLLPSMARACATGYNDQTSPMKALVVEYLRVKSVPALIGLLPSIEEVWLSRMADAGARERCVLMTGCPAAFSAYRSAQDTRFLVAWSVVQDLYSLPRDLANRKTTNAVLWAMFYGLSAIKVLSWLRRSIALAARQNSCAAKLLSCVAFALVANPHWAVHGRALAKVRQWPAAPVRIPVGRGNLPRWIDVEDVPNPCVCTESDLTRSNRVWVVAALNDRLSGYQNDAQRINAHNTGLTYLITQNWLGLAIVSARTWATLLSDLAHIALWADGHLRLNN
ncbi:hypothetical protein BDV18DRAFT_155440 [Aspergillus unguis]